MLHITCDICGKQVSTDADPRYVVKMEAFAAHNPAELTEADLDEDHMEAISEILREEAAGLVEPNELTPAYKKFRFDLCGDCHKKFLRDPLAKEAAQKFDFSEN